MELFAQGLIFGLAIAAPVGPIGVLTIRRTLVGGFFFGLLSGLGAATADAIYGTIAVLGLTAVSTLLIQYQLALQLIGGLFLLYLGIQAIRTKPVNSKQATTVDQLHNSSFTIHNSPFTPFRAYASTLFLTLSNPITILSFTAVFAGFGLGTHTNNAGSGLMLVSGVFLGSALWWLILTGVITAVRGRLNDSAFRGINIASGLILVGFAIALLAGLFLYGW